MSKSTVRNRFPRLAVRWAVALAVMAAVVAPPPPPVGRIAGIGAVTGRR